MKKLLLLLIIPLFFACSKDDEIADNIPVNPLLGTWELDYFYCDSLNNPIDFNNATTYYIDSIIGNTRCVQFDSLFRYIRYYSTGQYPFSTNYKEIGNGKIYLKYRNTSYAFMDNVYPYHFNFWDNDTIDYRINGDQLIIANKVDMDVTETRTKYVTFYDYYKRK